MKKALFLDRDGVINHDPGDYTKSVAEFTINPGVFEFLVEAKKLGYVFVIITNQGGIGKGLYTEAEVHEIHSYLVDEASKHGISFEGIYFCPHHPISSTCLCRKPGSLLIEKALYKHHINASKSYMIGDKPRDIECAENAGVKGFLVGVNEYLLNTSILKEIQ